MSRKKLQRRISFVPSGRRGTGRRRYVRPFVARRANRQFWGILGLLAVLAGLFDLVYLLL